jgi:3-isopropylmalate dehydratase small subunit
MTSVKQIIEEVLEEIERDKVEIDLSNRKLSEEEQHEVKTIGDFYRGMTKKALDECWRKAKQVV